MFNILKSSKDKILDLYPKIFLFTTIIFILSNLVRWTANLNTDAPFHFPPLNAWWTQIPYLIAYLILLVFAIIPLSDYVIYRLYYDQLDDPMKFIYTSIVCNVFVNILTIFGYFLLVIPGVYLSCKFMFLPFFIIENYKTMTPLEIIQKCYREGTYYSLLGIFVFNLIIGTIQSLIVSNVEFLWILVAPFKVAIHIALYDGRDQIGINEYNVDQSY